MLANESGPAAVFVRLRRAVGLASVAVQGPDGGWEQMQTASNPVAELFLCVWCLSVWTAGLLMLRPLKPLRTLLAASSLAILFHEALQWLRSHNA
jgi:hypothetical protein